MKEFFMEEFDKKVNEFLEKHTENFFTELQRLESADQFDYRMVVAATLSSSLNFTKEILRNYHAELLDYLEKRQ